MISHQHKTIFVHIPKCGGQSIEHMFVDDLGLTWGEREKLLMRLNDNPDLGPPRLAHLLARDYVQRGHVSQDDFDQYFKFSVVRDPYARVLSMYNYLKLNGPRTLVKKAISVAKEPRSLAGPRRMTMDEFVFDYLPDLFSQKDVSSHKSRYWFVRKQSDYVSGAEGAPLVDQIIRLEDLNASSEDLRMRCGLQAELRHVNKSVAKATPQALKPKHLDKIEELYKEDFDLLGYPRRERQKAEGWKFWEA